MARGLHRSMRLCIFTHASHRHSGGAVCPKSGEAGTRDLEQRPSSEHTIKESNKDAHVFLGQCLRWENPGARLSSPFRFENVQPAPFRAQLTAHSEDRPIHRRNPPPPPLPPTQLRASAASQGRRLHLTSPRPYPSITELKKSTE